jgi:hypothetical protein
MGPRKGSTKAGIVFFWNLFFEHEQLQLHRLCLIQSCKAKEKVARLYTITHNINNNKKTSESHVKSLTARVHLAVTSTSDHIISLWCGSGGQLHWSIEEGIKIRIFAADAGTARFSVEAEC